MNCKARKRSSISTDVLLQVCRSLKIWTYDGVKFRSVDSGSSRWLVFVDVCGFFAYKNPCDQIRKIDPSEKCKLEIGAKNTLVNCINRRGLLSFALFSNKAGAMEFYDWACREIFEEANEDDESDSEAGCGVGSGAGFRVPASDASEVQFDIACVAAGQ